MILRRTEDATAAVSLRLSGLSKRVASYLTVPKRSATQMSPSGLETRLALLAILSIFLVLGAVYSVASPIFEASDEARHYPYVKQLADGRGLPLPVADEAVNPALQEATQPPLYYAIAALATFWIDTGSANHLYVVNPHSQIGKPDSRDNKNMVVHTPAEAFPYRGIALAVHLVRLLSVVMGALTVLLTYLIAREALPARPCLALGAALVNALVPGFLFISAAVNNDNLVTPLASITLLLLLRLARREAASGESSPGPRLWRFALLGVVAGLAALSKLSGLALLLVIGVVLAWLALRRRSPQYLLLTGVVTYGAAFLVAGWWYVRNWLLFGDPTLLTQHLAIVRGRPEPVSLLDLLLREGEGLRWSFWGVFGGFNVVAGPNVYRAYDLASLLAVVGLLLALVRWLRARSARASHGELAQAAGGPNAPPTADATDGALPRWVPVALLGLWSAILLVSLLRWSQSTMASQGRLMFPAMSAMSLALFAGWRSLVPWLGPRALLASVGAPLLLLAALIPFRYIAPAYAVPPKLATGTVKALLGEKTVDVSYDDKIMLIACQLSEPVIVPGRPVTLDLYWRVLAPMDRNYSVYVHLYDGAGQVVAQWNTYPGGGAYATSLLSPGDELRDRYVLEVGADAKPGLGHLDVGLYEYPRTMERLQAYDGAHRLLPSPTIAWMQVRAPEPAPSPAQFAASHTFGDSIELAGYRFDLLDARPGGRVSGGLYWKARRRPDRDYTVFVHVAKPGSPPIAQSDEQPQGGGYPTSLWWPGDEVYHRFSIALGGDAQPGEYALLVGLYDQPTGRRLEVSPTALRRMVGQLWRLVGRSPARETAVQIRSLTIGPG